MALTFRAKARSRHRRRNAGYDDGLGAVLAAIPSFQSFRRLFLSLPPGHRPLVGADECSKHVNNRHRDRLRRGQPR